MTRIGATVACLLLACSTGAPPPVPTSTHDLTFDFRAGDGLLEPAILDVDRDGAPDYVMACKYELTRSEGYTMGGCPKRYTVTMAINRYGSNGNEHVQGSPWYWCSSRLPREYPPRRSALWIEWAASGWKVCVFDDIVRCAP